MTKHFLRMATFCVLLIGGPAVVQAETDWIVYKPGVVKAAVAKGDTVLLGYLSTW